MEPASNYGGAGVQGSSLVVFLKGCPTTHCADAAPHNLILPSRKLPQIENNMKIEASISLRRRDEEVKVYGEPDCWNLG